MSTLSELVLAHIPKELQLGRDYTGPRGWVPLFNQVLKRLEVEGLVKIKRKKEVGVEVQDRFWIAPPPDFRVADRIYSPELSRVVYNYEMVNGKLKLRVPYDYKFDPIKVTFSGHDASSAVVTGIEASADQYKGFLLVFETGARAILESNGQTDSETGETILTFLHETEVVPEEVSTGYLTGAYLMLQYFSTFTGITRHDEELPLDSKFDGAIIAGLCFLAKAIGSEDRAVYRNEFEYELLALGREEFTPSPDQARGIARPITAFEECGFFGNKMSSHFMDDEE